MRFLVDDMLGSLARWLRILGHDAEYAGDLDGGDDELLYMASDEDRTLLTRDVDLARRAEGSVLIDTKDLEGQLRTVAEECGLELEPTMERCTLCNSELAEADKAADDYVPEDAEELRRCVECGQFYWKGSHWDRIGEKLESVARDRHIYGSDGQSP